MESESYDSFMNLEDRVLEEFIDAERQSTRRRTLEEVLEKMKKADSICGGIQSPVALASWLASQWIVLKDWLDAELGEDGQ